MCSFSTVYLYYFRIYYGITKLSSLINTLKSCNNSNPHSTLQSVFISTLEEQIEDTSKYVEMIETTLDLNSVDRGDFLIKADFDEELESKFCVNSSNVKFIIFVYELIRILA